MPQEKKNPSRSLWQRLLHLTIGPDIDLPITQSIGMGRLREQLWDVLDEQAMESGDWAYPLDIFLGDDGSSLFSIVAQDGKLFQVPMTIAQDTLTLGDWTQVTEVFKPVTQSRFLVKRQKDGSYRWLSIAATTVLNRVGEIDSSELFDCFIKQAKENGKYPRLDFYHLGESDPKVWEFGTADYLARDGCCYIASGTFDDSLLARAAIKACQTSDEWGNSIEFYAYAEPEIILLDPKIQVPIYKEGENTRISMVLEKDAAGLFTRMIDVSEEKSRAMNKTVEAALKKLFGEDEEALNQFVENVDTVNRTVKNDKLIHRKKADPVDPDDADEDTTEDEDTEEDESEDTEDTEAEAVAQSIELDEEGMKHLVQQVSVSAEFSKLILPLTQSISDLSATVAELKTGRDIDSKEISRLKKANVKLVEQVNALSTDDAEKKQTWQQDLPARKAVQASYRPRDVHKDADEDAEEDFSNIADKTIANLKVGY